MKSLACAGFLNLLCVTAGAADTWQYEGALVYNSLKQNSAPNLETSAVGAGISYSFSPLPYVGNYPLAESQFAERVGNVSLIYLDGSVEADFLEKTDVNAYGATVTLMHPNSDLAFQVGYNRFDTQVSPAAARHAISVVKTVTNDTARRSVVDATKCANCHEWFEGHGGNRVIGIETGSSAKLVCVVCHVPGLATSGRRIPDTGANSMTTYAWTDADKQKLREWGLMNSSNQFIKTTNIALDLPVVTNNFKEMIHGIHAGHDRV